KTKIVCTIGPATKTVEKLTELVNAGMNVMRLNFSHGDFAEHQERVNNLKEVRKATGKTVAVLQDLGGPKIRTGEFKDGLINLKAGQTFTFTTEQIMGDEHRVSINYPLLPKEVKVGGFILVHDGKRKLQITAIKGKEVICKVIIGGEIKSRRGVNLPGAYLSVSSITEKDRKDLEFGIKNNVDFMALSFVRRSDDIIELRDILKKRKCGARIIAKIETPEALENIDAIIAAADGIMVARGDLAIEIPAEDVPEAQKMMISKCNHAGKPVITATQMLESMIKNSVPTRAEVSDIANAIIDGTDAIMLSEETTLGDYPVEAVEMMTRIALKMEPKTCAPDHEFSFDHSDKMTDIVLQSAVFTSKEVGAKYLVALTKSGRAARMLARYRPCQPILALMFNEKEANKLALSFGCFPIVVPHFSTLEEIMGTVRKTATHYKMAKKGDKVVIVAGMPIGKVKDTNMVLIETI
ncbi:MAG: pyruvate kinase, partial [bacterium]